jgi:hypothetical protein
MRQLRAAIRQGGRAAEREADADRDRQAVIADLRSGAGDATRYQPDETTGYGSTARWARAETREEIISSYPTPVRLIPQIGARKQLARYTDSLRAASPSAVAVLPFQYRPVSGRLLPRRPSVTPRGDRR